jgi:hypothetical protein
MLKREARPFLPHLAMIALANAIDHSNALVFAGTGD